MILSLDSYNLWYQNLIIGAQVILTMVAIMAIIIVLVLVREWRK